VSLIPLARASMMALMMPAMMVPSMAPALWRHHRMLAEAGVPRAASRTTLVGLGYAAVWTAIGMALFALDASLRGHHMSSMGASFAPGAAGAVFLCAGALQCSTWKANYLARCRVMFDARCTVAPNTVLAAWQDGCRLGVRCAASCMAPMAILFVVGVMDARATAVITAAICAERLLPNGVRIARLTGALALGVGLVISARAIGVA